MDRKINEKLHALDPRFRKQISDLFERMHQSVSLPYEAATHDEKTGLYNNKFFETCLDMEIEKARRKKRKLSLIIVDIDFFKKINDLYGHVKADEILERLAQLVKKQIRVSDIAARFGGEEFIILLPETNIERAKKLCARLKKAVKTDKILKKYKLTISGGIAEFKEKDSKKKFKERADKALYKAKETGRDRFIAVR